MSPRPEQFERVKSLRLEIERHRRLYYRENAPEISDREYDLLEWELAQLENRFPELADEASPSNRVGF